MAGGAGFNAYLIRNTWAPFYATGSIRKVEGKWGIADHQEPLPGPSRGKSFREQGNGNNSLEADEALGPRGIIRYATLDEFKANPNFAHEGEDARDAAAAIPRCFPTGLTTRPMPGPCRST